MTQSKLIPFTELGEVIAGQHVPADEYDAQDDGTPYLTGPADFTDRAPRITKWTKHPRSFAQEGDVLLTVKGAGCGKSNLGVGAAIGRQLMALRPNPSKLDRNFLFAVIRSQEQRIAHLGQGATVPGIAKGDIEQLQIPYFPLAEQCRIARILDKADRLRRLRWYGYQQCESILPSAFLEMFGDMQSDATRWTRFEFNDLCRISDKTVDPKDPAYCNLPQISSEDIQSVSGELGPLRTAKEKGVISVNFLVAPDEIVFSKIRPRLRKVAYPKIRALCSADIYPIRAVAQECHPQYLLFYLRSDYFSRIVANLAEARCNIPKVNRDELSEQTIPIPPLSLQQKFATLVERIGRLSRNHREALRQAEHLFQTLLHRAFTSGL